MIEALNDWRKAERDLATRPEAIRRLLEGALGKRTNSAPGSISLAPAME